MKGIILAGGLGRRMLPITKVINKHLIAVKDKCMVQYPLETLTSAGIKDILVVTGGEHLGAFLEFLGSGKEFGCKLTYKVQDEPAGIADAIRYAEDFTHGERFVVILGDNYFGGSIEPYLTDWAFTDSAMILLSKTERWHNHGVARVDDAKIVEIVEKPTTFISDLVITGMYCLNNKAFQIINDLNKSDRGEYEITDVLRAYLDKKLLRHELYNDFWTDMGTFEGRKRVENNARQ